MNAARAEGHCAIIIFGEPGYYPRFGFKTCDHYGITTPDGKNFDALMGYELNPDGLKNVKGKFYESNVFEKLPDEKTETFSEQFPTLVRYHLPGQWS